MKKFKSKTKNFSTEFFIDFANSRPLPDWLLPQNRNAEQGYWNKFKYDTSKIPEVHTSLAKVLNQIIADGELKESEWLHYFINVSRAMIVSFEVVDGKLERIVDYAKGEDTELKDLANPMWLKELADDLLGYRKALEKGYPNKAKAIQSFLIPEETNARETKIAKRNLVRKRSMRTLRPARDQLRPQPPAV